MGASLTTDVLQDELAVSLARAVAASNKRARQSGIDVTQSLIAISQRVSDDRVVWRVHYGPKDAVGRRGDDLIIDVDPMDASITQVLRGQ